MDTQDILLLYTTPTGGVTTNDLEIAALLTQVHIFAPKIHTLVHIHRDVDNTAAQRWEKGGSIIFEMAVIPTLQDLAMLTQTHSIYSSFQRIASSDNKMADSTSMLTHLTQNILLQRFALNFQ